MNFSGGGGRSRPLCGPWTPAITLHFVLVMCVHAHNRLHQKKNKKK